MHVRVFIFFWNDESFLHRKSWNIETNMSKATETRFRLARKYLLKLLGEPFKRRFCASWVVVSNICSFSPLTWGNGIQFLIIVLFFVGEGFKYPTKKSPANFLSKPHFATEVDERNTSLMTKKTWIQRKLRTKTPNINKHRMGMGIGYTPWNSHFRPLKVGLLSQKGNGSYSNFSVHHKHLVTCPLVMQGCSNF